jgi:3-hydroxyacyl-[acyl-carrier-protein] dehydratase
MILDKIAVAELLPQKNPFVQVDTLIEYSEHTCTTSFCIPAIHPMVMEGQAMAGLLMENIAQSAALHMGYSYRDKHENNPVGFIAEIKNAFVNNLPKTGEEMQTKIEIEHQVFNCIILNGKVYKNDEMIAGCTMKVFINVENA